MIKTPNFLSVDNIVTIPNLTDVGLNTLVNIKYSLILLVYRLAIQKLLYSSMFSVWGATVVQKLVQDHHQQHHKQLLLQLHPSVDPGLSPLRQGGQHIRSAAQDANSTSFASAANSSHLESQFLQSHLHEVQTCCQRRSAAVFITWVWQPSLARQPIPLPKGMGSPKSQSCFPGIALRCCKHTIACVPPISLLVSVISLMADKQWDTRIAVAWFSELPLSSKWI